MILIPRINQLGKLPAEYWLYGSLILFSFIGIFQVTDFKGYFRYLQVLVSNLILMITIYLVIRDLRDWEKLLRYFWLSVTLLVILGYLFYAGDANSEHYRFAGLLDNSNGTATYSRAGILAALVLFHLSRSIFYKAIYAVSIVFLSFVIILTASRGNLLNLGFILFSVFYIRYFSGWKSLILILLMFVSFSYVSNMIISYLDDFYVFERLSRNEDLASALQNEGRIQLYLSTFHVFLEHPIFGVGLNQFRQYSGGKISHTDFLDILSQLGLIAGALYATIYFKLLKRLRKLLKQGLDNYLVKLLIIVLLSELIFGLTNPNWFLQLDMIILSLLITFSSKSIAFSKQKSVQNHIEI